MIHQASSFFMISFSILLSLKCSSQSAISIFYKSGFEEICIQRLESLPWIPPAREIKALSLFVLHSHTQYATAHPLLQRQGSMNLLLLTKHIQVRAEQRWETREASPQIYDEK